MKLFRNKDIDKQAIAVEFERGLDDESLKDFRKAVDLYRKGDKLQAEYYNKGNAVMAGTTDAELDLELMEGENG